MSRSDNDVFSNIFQRDHVHGGGQRRDDHPGAQLSSQTRRHSPDARMGIQRLSRTHNNRSWCSGSRHIPPVDPLVPQDVPSRGEDHQEDNHDAEEDERNGAEGDILQVAAGERS